MILVDTSVWVHFLRGNKEGAPLGRILESGEVCTHSWIIGELALGSLGRKRNQILSDMRRLPSLSVVADEEVLFMIDESRLSGSGIGWVDAQLLASALVAGVDFWSTDKRLSNTAASVGL